ncbi:ABC transporter substrate-binding protein [Geosporobacter ferrireducens]|uniref:ABC transporter substrate-binding protein n=1 Tax=Geosporobacter ferrireducens TaxID=1424294 RepID=UPI00139CFA90|nr:extracellular solute-binding protein [Geosporobacter ferrireducens]MTI54236.1 extracellular solute-binding protein [Geosporobacter ferrireducens]
MYKKTISLLLVIIFAMGLFACGRRNEKVSQEDGDNTVQDQKVITVSVPASNRQLEIAASKFQKEHPEYRIDIQTYPSSDYETYVKNLNTQIMSGKGADIISVAGLPFENYVDRNILTDIGDLMAKDSSFDMSKYYTNIFDALKTNGSLYVLPTSFTFNVLMANQEILDKEAIEIDDSKWTWNDFKLASEKVTQKDGAGAGNRAALPGVSSMDMLNLFTGGSYSNYIDADNKKASFTSEGFIDLLNTVKAFGDETLVNSNVQTDMVAVLEAAGRGSIVFYPCNIDDYFMYWFMKSALNDHLSLYNIPSAGNSGSRTFTTNSLYAINKNSKYTEITWEFLKVLLSDEIQSQALQEEGAQGKPEASGGIALGGFPINRTAQQQKAQLAIDTSKDMKMNIRLKLDGPGEISLSPAAMTQVDIDYIDKFISELNTYANADPNIDKIIRDEAKAFFNGDKSAEVTAELIQRRVNTYLGE